MASDKKRFTTDHMMSIECIGPETNKNDYEVANESQAKSRGF
jgi:hypothetical protein